MLGELLKQKGLITQEQLELALQYQAKTGEFLGKILINLGFISGTELIKALASQEEMSLIEVEPFVVDPQAMTYLSEEEALEFHVLPLAKIKETFFVAVPVTVDEKKIKELSQRLQFPLEPIFVVKEPDNFKTVIQQTYQHVRERQVAAKKIGAFLKSEGLITLAQLDDALNAQKKTNEKIGRILMDKGYLNEIQFYSALARQLKIPFLSLTEAMKELDPAVASLCSPMFASHYKAIPLGWKDGKARILVTDPHDEYVVDAMMKLMGREVELAIATESTISVIINSIFKGKTEIPSLEVEDVTEVERLDLLEGYKDPEIPKILNFLLYKAITERASDIHIERYEDRVDVRFRIDGVMIPVHFPLIHQNNILRVISKLKIDAKLDIAERRKPQDGSFRKRFGHNKRMDFRLAIQPTLYGESAVIRILDQTAKIPSLESLGFSEEILKRYRRLISNPQGLILLTGPTGSGKSTTLYATMNILRAENNKILTAEDPIEYSLEGVQQCQVYDLIGNTFANYLRSFLRADPDIILIGEIRDADTAEMTVRASLTGHLVFSTLHVNDAVSVIRRLEDLGIEPNLIAQSLSCVISQRLVRRICLCCRQEETPSPELLSEFYPKGLPTGVTFYRGVGCKECNMTGFRGRIGLYEFWEPDEKTKELINWEKSINVIRNFAIERGMKPLILDGIAKVEQGITTLSELRTALSWEDIRRLA